MYRATLAFFRIFRLKHFLLMLVGAGIAFLPVFGVPKLVLAPKFHDIVTVFLSVVMEATPFLLIGSVVSFLIQRSDLMPKLLRRIPKNPFLGLPTAALFGTLLPICECGNVPIAKSLVQKGLSSAYATTFLFAAPILNPAVVLSTWIAFRGQPAFIATRFLFGFIVAVLIGAYVLSRERAGKKTWKDMPQSEADQCAIDTPHSQHTHRPSAASGILQEFFGIFPLLVFGAFATAIFQAFVPRSVFFSENFGGAMAIALMMLFAFVISVCSSSDAFIGLAYSGIVPPAAIMSFLVLGPVLDAKNGLIYGRIFTRPGLLLISLVTIEIVFVGALFIHKFGLL